MKCLNSALGGQYSQTQRDYSIDVLKCVAALVITWSHLNAQLGPFGNFATGGSFGDCLFFFCSGYTLLLSRKKTTFLNWYKNRVNRIYPTVFAWALLSCILLKADWNMLYILTEGGGYFVTCIMLFYLIVYPIRQLSYKQQTGVAFLYYGFCILCYFFIDHNNFMQMYNWTWSMYFLPMLMGAMMGKAKKEGTNYRLKNLNSIWSIALLVVSAAMYYVLMHLTSIGSALDNLRPLIILPQLGVVFGFYRLCCCKFAERLCTHRWTYIFIMFVGSICLEIYIVQPPLLHRFVWFQIFPLNIPVIFVIILASAFVLKIFARLWEQTFKDADYNWKEIIKLY